MRTYIETALRIKWRLLFSMLVLFAIALAALYYSKQGYTSSAMIWVEQPLYLKDPTNANPYVSAAQNQADIFNELLSTQEFALGIAQAAGMDVQTDADKERATTDLRRNLTVNTAGPHLIKMSYTSGRSAYVQSVVTQSIQLFIKQMNQDRTRQAQLALGVYQNELAQYQQEMNTSKDALTKYLQDNPSLLEPGAPTSPVLTDLQMQYTTNRDRYNGVLAQIDQINSQSASADQVNNQFFRVIDSPSAPKPNDWATKDFLRNGGIAAVPAIFALVALILVTTWTNTVLYTPGDVSTVLQSASGVNDLSQEVLVTVVPYLSASALRGGKRRKSRERHSGQAATQPGRDLAAAKPR